MFPFYLPFILAGFTIIMMLLYRISSSLYILYLFSVIWMGVSWYFFITLIAADIISYAYTLPWQLVFGFAVGISIYALINAMTINIRKLKIDLGKKIRLVQWSDLHIGSVKGFGYLKRIIDKTNKLKPDILVITGDLFDSNVILKKDMMKIINRIKAPIYFVTGNHELYEGIDDVIKVLSRTKVKILRDESVNIKGIQFIGIDFSDDRKYLEKVLPTFKIKKPSVLLMHSPDSVEYASRSGIDLMLSGHTHNGQIFPFNVFVRMFYRYVVGLHKIGNMFLNISPGLI